MRSDAPVPTVNLVLVIFGERHLRHVLLSYLDYYNGARTHLSLNEDEPIARAAETAPRGESESLRRAEEQIRLILLETQIIRRSRCLVHEGRDPNLQTRCPRTPISSVHRAKIIKQPTPIKANVVRTAPRNLQIL